MNHARLSASAAHRWIKCPGSARLSADAPRSSSVYAAQGTVAHAIAADMIRLGTGYAPPPEGKIILEDGYPIRVDREMLDGAQFYVGVVADDTQPGDLTWTEVDLIAPLSKLHPALGGNADHIRFRPSTGELRVIDFKYGAGVMVSAVANEQLLTYALGAMLHIGSRYPVKTVVSTIVQPRIESEEGRVRDYTFPAIEILAFAATLVEAARATEAPDAPLTPGDEQCQWCPAKATCPALAANQSALLATDFSVQAYDPLALSKALDMIGPLEAKIKHIREFAFAEAEAGRFGQEHGYKLVAKRATRKWKDEDAVRIWAQDVAHVSPYAELEILSPAQLEKKLKKAEKAEMAAFVESKSSGNTLVPVSDDRPAINPLAIASEFTAMPANDNLLEFKTP